MDLGDTTILVKRRAFSTGTFMPPGVEVVNPVFKVAIASQLQLACSTVPPKAEDNSLLDVDSVGVHSSDG